MRNSEDLADYALRMRRDILAMAHYAGGAHIAPAYSIIDVLSVLFNGVLDFSVENWASSDRDHFILSKGHGCAALYAVLAEKGFFDRSELKRFCRPTGILGGHPDMHKVPGLEASTGSLGHGFLFAVGLAYGKRLKESSSRIFTLIGDGECQEGSIWESALLAGTLKLGNLVAVLDYNKLQGMGPVKDINDLEPISDKWRSFGWQALEINGHDFHQIEGAFNKAKATADRPTMIIAHTIKGKGLSFMEGKTIWHYKLPKGPDMVKACQELGITGDITGVLP